MVVEKATELVPDPRFVPPTNGARVPNVSLHEPGLVVAKRNQPVADAPFGLAEPFNLDEVLVILLAALVVTSGAAGVKVIRVAMRLRRAPLVPAESTAPTSSVSLEALVIERPLKLVVASVVGVVPVSAYEPEDALSEPL